MTGLGREELERFLDEQFPQVADDFAILEAAPRSVLLRLDAEERHLRPGGTISGPTLFALADVAVYLAIQATLGMVPLAVTTSCAVDFLRKPASGAVLCRARLWKVGRVLVVGEAHLFADGQEEAPVARAQLTYSIPPRQ